MNTLYAIDHDLNFLQHDGVPGMSWHKHKFGKWQSQAVYAQGMPNPDAKEKKGLKGAVEKAKNAVSDAVTRHQAKNDAAITAMDTYGGKTKGARRLAGGVIGSSVAGAAVGAAAGKVIGDAMGKTSGVDAKADYHANEWQRYNSNRRNANTYAMNFHAHPETQLRGPSGMEQYHWNQYKKFSNASNNAKLATSFTTTIGGSLLGANLYKASTLNGYIKRSAGSLRNTKMSPRRQEVYRQTYDKYLKQYSQATKVNWGKVYAE
mgnify:CR=1 FL=1